MQTFLPYPDFKKSASVLDYKRLGKQRVEAMQIVNSLCIDSYGWKSHPAVKMWDGFVMALADYHNCIIEEWMLRGYNNNMEFYEFNDMVKPHWIGKEELHSSHRANLLRKDYEHYSQFNWTEDPTSPYVWQDDKDLWYEQHVGTGIRVYF